MNNKGFGILPVILVLIVIGVIGAGFYYLQQNNKSEIDTSITNSSNSPDGASEEISANTDYLEIPELGVKIGLNDVSRDLTYSMQLMSDDKTIAVLSSRSLTSLEADCSASTAGPFGVSGVGHISYYNDPSADGPFPDSTNAQSFPDALKINGKHYFIQANLQGVCYDENEHEYESEVGQKVSELTKFLRDDATLESL